ncbi:MAG: NAD(+)/NADH kinase [Bacilli bacterium]|nr:NAD(+)/NADH kinase [Bacilli bacterium]
MKKIKLCCKNDYFSLKVKKRLISYLEQANFIITNETPDLIIAIGGDGTFIKALKESNYDNKPFYIGVNSGTLGFLQEIEIKDLKSFVQKLKNNKLKHEQISMQETKVVLKSGEIYFYRSFNEIVIRESALKILKVNVEIEDFKLEHFLGDGLLIATSTGSTAHNLSLGGSIVHQYLATLQITPIGPLNNKVYRTLNNSVVVPENMIIKIIPTDNDNQIMVTIDGDNKNFTNVKYIETKSCSHKLNILKFNNFNYWQKIESKFLK